MSAHLNWSERVATRSLGWLLATTLRVVRATWRVRTTGIEVLDAARERGENVLIAFWHTHYVPMFILLGDRQGTAVTSRSFRGDVIANICRRFGYDAVAVRDRGGTSSLALLRSTLRAAPLAGIAVDGPLGPRQRVKRGAVHLAAELGCTLVPIAVAARRAHVIHRRWDRMEIPRPFTDVALVVEEGLHVPTDLDSCGVYLWQGELQARLERAGERARTLVGADQRRSPAVGALHNGSEEGSEGNRDPRPARRLPTVRNAPHGP